MFMGICMNFAHHCSFVVKLAYDGFLKDVFDFIFARVWRVRGCCFLKMIV